MIAALFVVALLAGAAGVYIGRASVRLEHDAMRAYTDVVDDGVDGEPYYGPVRRIGPPFDWNRDGAS